MNKTWFKAIQSNREKERKQKFIEQYQEIEKGEKEMTASEYKEEYKQAVKEVEQLEKCARVLTKNKYLGLTWQHENKRDSKLQVSFVLKGGNKQNEQWLDKRAALAIAKSFEDENQEQYK